MKANSATPLQLKNRLSGRWLSGRWILGMLACVTLIQTGCVGGVLANLMHVVGADMVPADYPDLEDSRVAIVTRSESSDYKDDVAADLLSKNVGSILTQEVDDLRLVRQSEIDAWRDRAGWQTVDFVDLGREVEADKIISIELSDLKLREGQSLFRGSANVEVAVIDPATGDELYRRQIDEYTFPQSAGQHINETTENRFRKVYLSMLAKEIARSFHAYDFSDTFALDGAIASQ